MPGQLPTRADAPVTRLKNVDLPVFGMPTSAIRFTAPSRSANDFDLPRLPAPKDDVGGAQPDVERPREGSPANHPDPLSGPESEGGKAHAQCRVGMNGADGRV